MKIKPSRLREIIQEEVSQFNSRMSAPPDDITGEPDDEGAMARSQLLKLAKYSDALMGMMNDNTQLPAWVQAKITKSASYLGAVKHFIEGEVELNEAVDGDPQSNTVSVERHLIQNVVNAFDEYAPGPRRDYYLVRDEADEKPASDLIDSMQALEQILNPVSKNAESDPEQQMDESWEAEAEQQMDESWEKVKALVKEYGFRMIEYHINRMATMEAEEYTKLFGQEEEPGLNEEKQKTRKVTVEGKTYKIKK